MYNIWQDAGNRTQVAATAAVMRIRIQIRICIIKVGSGSGSESVWRDTNPDPDPGHTYYLYGKCAERSNCKYLKLILYLGLFFYFYANELHLNTTYNILQAFDLV